MPYNYIEEKEAVPFLYKTGDQIMLNIEGYENRVFIITKVNEQKRKMYISVEMFGREVEMEVGEEDIAI